MCDSLAILSPLSSLCMNTLGIPLLSLIIFIPLLGAIATAFVSREIAGRVALIFSLVSLALSGILIFYFLPIADFQFVERVPWIEGSLGQYSILVEYYLGIDGISFWLIPLTTLLTSLAIWSSFEHINERPNEYYAFMLLLECGILGVFCALDLFLFFVFWEAVLIPMYFLIGIWGGNNRIYATVKFVLYTMAGSALMLATIIALGVINLVFGFTVDQSLTLRFGLDSLLQAMEPRTFAGILEQIPFFPANVAMLMFVSFALAFAIKVPLFPFHTWLPDAHVQAPTAGSVMLAGVLLKMGTYSFLRFAIPLFPVQAREVAPIIAVLSIIGILYGAWVAYAQKDIKSLVAYSSVSHLGFVMLGMFALNSAGVSGSILQMVNHGISTGALFLLVGMIYERRHTRDMEAFGGLWKIMPIYAGLFLITMLASVGLPGLNGFVGEFLTLLGAYAANPWWAYFATFGVVLAAIYMLQLFNKMFFGPVTNEENRHLVDLSRKEILVLVPLVLLMILMGVAPNLFLAPMQPSVTALVESLQNVTAVGVLP